MPAEWNWHDLVALVRPNGRRSRRHLGHLTEAAAKDLSAELGQELAVPILVGGAGAPLEELVDAASVAREAHAGRFRSAVRPLLASAGGH